MASNIDIKDNLVNKERCSMYNEVCPKTIFLLSNNNIKLVLSKYSSYTLEEKAIVKRFRDDLKLNNINRYRNLHKFFVAAFKSDETIVNKDETTGATSTNLESFSVAHIKKVENFIQQKDLTKSDSSKIEVKIPEDQNEVKQTKSTDPLKTNQQLEKNQKDSSKSDFLKECNLLKTIISKNLNTNDQSSNKQEQIAKKKKKRKRKKKKSNNDECVLNSNEIKIPEEEKPIIIIPEDETQTQPVNAVNCDITIDQLFKLISEKQCKQEVKCKLEKTIEAQDLMVLLKYFFKLDELEQYRLIDFLKELELSDPERFADLQKHVRIIPPNVEKDTQYSSNNLDDRPESRNSDLSNIDLILEDIDSILNDEDNEEPSNKNKDDFSEPPLKRLKTDNVIHEYTNNFEEKIPLQYNNHLMRNSNNFTTQIQCTNIIQQNVNYITQYQNYKLNENQYFPPNMQQAYQSNVMENFLRNQNTSFQNQQNVDRFQNYQKYSYRYNNQDVQNNQNYSRYQNNGYF